MGTPSSPGAPTPLRGMGVGDLLSKTPGMGDFFENPPGVFGGFYVIKTAVIFEILLKKIFFVPLCLVIASLQGVITC